LLAVAEALPEFELEPQAATAAAIETAANVAAIRLR
jgi:hypothetical protein